MKNNKVVSPFSLSSSSNSRVSFAPTDYKIYLVNAFTYSAVNTRRQAIYPKAKRHATLRSLDSHYFSDWEMNGSTENIRPSLAFDFKTSERNEPNHFVWSSPFTSRQYWAHKQNTKPFCLAVHLTRVYLSMLWPWYANSCSQPQT